jgi:hypothetical protein
MAHYLINYLTGDTETVTADTVNIDCEARAFVFHATANEYKPVALVPQANVRSIHRQDDESAKERSYPYQDGDVTVLGPEVFASADGEAISWKGTPYARRPYPALGTVSS